MVRTFIAAEISQPVRESLSRDLERLKILAPRIQWSKSENLHLTLRFLGDVPEKDLEELFEALEDGMAEAEPFALEVTGVGVFPNWRHPRVIWAGCGEGADDAVALAGAVDDVCEELGYERERRPFRPHLTLGRVKLPADAEGLEKATAEMRDRLYGYMDVDAVVVFMSSLRRAGPVYSPMARIELR